MPSVHRKGPPFKLRRLDTQTRWLVESASEPGTWYLCDLMANVKIGRCDCADFVYNKSPAAVRADIPSDDLRCKHLRYLRERFTNALLDEIGKNEKNRENE